mmetsp:Transcript_40693/g.111944  ORF Transcript_40693/g.111944 Transcript_40693/m.111944 type:complete len:259 (-) Transcript_40693:281-1057(-)
MLSQDVGVLIIVLRRIVTTDVSTFILLYLLTTVGFGGCFAFLAARASNDLTGQGQPWYFQPAVLPAWSFLGFIDLGALDRFAAEREIMQFVLPVYFYFCMSPRLDPLLPRRILAQPLVTRTRPELWLLALQSKARETDPTAHRHGVRDRAADELADRANVQHVHRHQGVEPPLLEPALRRLDPIVQGRQGGSTAAAQPAPCGHPLRAVAAAQGAAQSRLPAAAPEELPRLPGAPVQGEFAGGADGGRQGAPQVSRGDE